MTPSRRKTLLTVLAMLASGLRAHGETLPPGLITIDLTQWTGVRLRWKGQEYVIAPDELWEGLRER